MHTSQQRHLIVEHDRDRGQSNIFRFHPTAELAEFLNISAKSVCSGRPRKLHAHCHACSLLHATLKLTGNHAHDCSEYSNASGRASQRLLHVTYSPGMAALWQYPRAALSLPIRHLGSNACVKMSVCHHAVLPRNENMGLLHLFHFTSPEYFLDQASLHSERLRMCGTVGHRSLSVSTRAK